MARVEPLSEAPSHDAMLRRTVRLLRPFWPAMSVAVVVSVAASACLTLSPVIIGNATDAMLAGDADLLWRLVILLAVVVAARAGLQFLAEWLLARVGELVARFLRDRAIDRLATADVRLLEEHREGDLTSRVSTEITALATFIRTQVPTIVYGMGYMIIITGVLLQRSWLMTLIAVVVYLPANLWLISWYRRVIKPVVASLAAAHATATATYAEGLQSRELLQDAGGTGQWAQRLAADGDTVRRTTRRGEVLSGLSYLRAFPQALADAAVIVSGTFLVIRGVVTVGTVVVFVLALRALFESFGQVSLVITMWQRTKSNLARLLDLFARTDHTDRGSTETVAAQSLPPGGEIEIDGVSFAYLDEPVLRNVSLRIPAGSVVGLLGQTGAGKTTLAKLIAGLYTPDSGEIRYAGIPLTRVAPERLRERILLVPQQVALINGTVADNIGLVPGGADRDRIERAVAQLGVDRWIASLPDMLDTDVGQRGAALSAGERQLIGLIRAALLDPAVVLLDEATADIDPRTAERLETAMQRIQQGRTLIIIAHRLATIERLPMVIRVTAGGVVGELERRPTLTARADAAR